MTDLSHRRAADLSPVTRTGPGCVPVPAEFPPTDDAPAFAATVVVVCVLGSVALLAWTLVALAVWRALA